MTTRPPKKFSLWYPNTCRGSNRESSSLLQTTRELYVVYFRLRAQDGNRPGMGSSASTRDLYMRSLTPHPVLVPLQQRNPGARPVSLPLVPCTVHLSFDLQLQVTLSAPWAFFKRQDVLRSRALITALAALPRPRFVERASPPRQHQCHLVNTTSTTE